MKRRILLCRNCNCMTHTKEGTIYICSKCGEDRRRKKQEEKYPEQAIELLDKYFPKTKTYGKRSGKRGEAMAILSIAFLEGREIGKKERWINN